MEFSAFIPVSLCVRHKDKQGFLSLERRLVVQWGLHLHLLHSSTLRRSQIQGYEVPSCAACRGQLVSPINMQKQLGLLVETKYAN